MLEKGFLNLSFEFREYRINWSCALFNSPQFVHVWNPRMGRAGEKEEEVEN